MRVDMLCVWWHHPSGGGVVESAGYFVFFTVLWNCLLCPQYVAATCSRLCFLSYSKFTYLYVHLLVVYLIMISHWLLDHEEHQSR
jgi:hypothetical protein